MVSRMTFLSLPAHPLFDRIENNSVPSQNALILSQSSGN